MVFRTKSLARHRNPYEKTWIRPACGEYAADLADLEVESRKATLNRWICDMGNAKVISLIKDGLPAYGPNVEKDLVSDIVTRNALGLLMDNHVLRELLLQKLVQTNQTNLILENGWPSCL
jgi:hypothetical protein